MKTRTLVVLASAICQIVRGQTTNDLPPLPPLKANTASARASTTTNQTPNVILTNLSITITATNQAELVAQLQAALKTLGATNATQTASATNTLIEESLLRTEEERWRVEESRILRRLGLGPNLDQPRLPGHRPAIVKSPRYRVTTTNPNGIAPSPFYGFR